MFIKLVIVNRTQIINISKYLGETISYKNISPEEVKIKLKESDNVILLDVRTKKEYDKKHIPNSILIPLDNLNDDVENKIKDKESEIIVYCRSGRRSKIACETLAKLGYNDLYNLDGGIKNWKYEVE